MNKRMWLISLVLMAVTLVPVACGGLPSPLGSGSSQPAPAPGGSANEVGLPGNKDASGIGDNLPGVSAERMIVRNGNLALKVTDVTTSRDRIVLLAASLGGYVVSSSIFASGEILNGSISIRVPDDQFEAAIAQIRALAVKVDHESTSSQDITQEYVDLQSRLKNAQATESQYLALLLKASTVTEILSIQDKLAQTRQQIEQLKGRIQYLEQTAALSLITVSLSPEEGNNPVTWLNWNFGGILKSAASGLIIFLQILVAIIIWVLVFSPIWGAVVGMIYWLRRRKRIRSYSSIDTTGSKVDRK
jgi:hypothetical protein